MRILIAYDGSHAADEAVALARSVAWPPDSTIRVVAVAEPPVVVLAAPWAPGSTTIAPEIDDQMVAYLDDRVADAVRRLTGAAGHVEGVVLRGRPAQMLERHRQPVPGPEVVSPIGEGVCRQVQQRQQGRPALQRIRRRNGDRLCRPRR